MIPEGTISHRPSSFYFRRDLRATDDPEELRAIAMAVVEDRERLRFWVREQGLIPPKWIVSPEEAKEKGYEQTA